jgi:hypothetical protein
MADTPAESAHTEACVPPTPVLPAIIPTDVRPAGVMLCAVMQWLCAASCAAGSALSRYRGWGQFLNFDYMHAGILVSFCALHTLAGMALLRRARWAYGFSLVVNTLVSVLLVLVWVMILHDDASRSPLQLRDWLYSLNPFALYALPSLIIFVLITRPTLRHWFDPEEPI